MRYDLSVIIPVINEEERIADCIARIKSQKYKGTLEIIVCDGHPKRTTINKINDKNINCISSPMGRALQMNAGAENAFGDILLFLHCDTILPENGLNDILTAMKIKDIVAGAFNLSINKKGLHYRIIEKTASLRSRLTRIPYGDQAIFINRPYFFEIGQYKPISIMEDVALMQKIKKDNRKIIFLKTAVATSARRWEKEGLIYGTLRNWVLIILFLCGVSPDRLAAKYKIH